MKRTAKEKLLKALKIILHILLIPIVVVEYFVTYWFWGGDGMFMLISMPVFFVIFLIAQQLIRKRLREKRWVQQIMPYSMVLLTPVLATLACHIAAWICRYEIVIT